jgi:hypothetical protein
MRLFLALALLAAAPAFAQAAAPATPRERLIAADANKDGKIDATELADAPAALAKLAAGEAVDPSEIYFRTLIRFETGAADLAWMNKIIAVGVGQRPPSGPCYDVYAVK